MKSTNHWLLPSGIEEQLPANAAHIEHLRRQVLDLFSVWGYDLIITPLVEYLESLTIDGDRSLDMQTLKLTDTVNGKTMGVRADITPQVARIDSHRLASDSVERLCYMGTVLRAKPDTRGARVLLQFGAEIYGHAGIDSSVEIIRLMASTLQVLGIRNIHIDIGHVGIYSAFAKAAGLTDEQKQKLFGLIQFKAAHEIKTYLHEQGIKPEYVSWFTQLIELYGDVEVLNSAKQIFKGSGADTALAELESIFQNLVSFGITPKFDLGELGSYFYETGVVFSVFIEGIGQEIVRGGRYDNIGKVFGRARPAVGFSSDLLLLASLLEQNTHSKYTIYAPWGKNDPVLQAKIAALRTEGKRVIEQLEESECQYKEGDKMLVRKNNNWVIADT